MNMDKRKMIVLQGITHALKVGEEKVTTELVASYVPMSLHQVERTMHTLERDGYVRRSKDRKTCTILPKGELLLSIDDLERQGT